MVATEAKYHRPCLLKLYNKYRDFKWRKFVDDYQNDFAQGMCCIGCITLGSHEIPFYGQFNLEKNL